jgi:hypothetical protein
MLHSVPTISHWFDRMLDDNDWSQAKIARHLNRDKSQINRWVNGREAVPAPVLAEIAALLGDDVSVMYVGSLYLCERTAEELRKVCAELGRAVGIPGESLVRRLLSLAESLPPKHLHPSTPGYVALLSRYLTDAVFAVRVAQETSSYDTPVLTRDNIARHLVFPVNRFVGALLDHTEAQLGRLTESSSVLRRTSLNSLRSIATKTGIRNGIESWCFQHSVHMLARHGETDDRALIQRLISSDDVLIRRMGLFGLFLGTKSEEDIEQVRHILSTDSVLAQATLAFDALHYGDTKLNSNGNVDPKPANPIRAVVRSLESLLGEEREGIRAICASKLIYAASHCGNGVLDNSLALPLVGQVVAALSDRDNRSRSAEENSLLAILEPVTSRRR